MELSRPHKQYENKHIVVCNLSHRSINDDINSKVQVEFLPASWKLVCVDGFAFMVLSSQTGTCVGDSVLSVDYHWLHLLLHADNSMVSTP